MSPTTTTIITVVPQASNGSHVSCSTHVGTRLQWSLPFQNPGAQHLLLIAAVAVVLGSCFNLLCAAFLFGQVLQPPGGFHNSSVVSWTDCNCTLDTSETATALGVALPLEYVEAVVSISTILAIGVAGLLLCSLYVGGRRYCLVIVVQFVLVALSVSVILAIPGYTFFLELASQAILSTWIFFCIIFLEPYAHGHRTTRNSAVLFGTVLLGLCCLVSINAVVAAKMANAVLVYGGALLVHKAVEALWRLLLKQVDFLPPDVCAFILLGYQSAGQITLRRHTLALQTVPEAVMAGALQCLTEVLQAACGTGCMVWMFNATVDGNPIQAQRVLKVGAYGVLADVVCEHVAMQTALGYALFMDEKVWNLALGKGPGDALRSSFVLMSFELLSDCVVLLMLFGFLPPTHGALDLSALPGQRLQQCAVFLSLCAWMCVTGLSGLTRAESFSCSSAC